MMMSKPIQNGKRLHPLAAVLSSLKLIKDMLLPLLIFLATAVFNGGGHSGAGGWRMAASATIIAGAIGCGILSWLRYRYEVAEGMLKVEHGIFVVKRQFIPLERIQTIDLTEGPLHRLLGLARMQVQTAGGGKPEAVFTAVTRDEALLLQKQLRGHNQGEPYAEAGEALGAEEQAANRAMEPMEEGTPQQRRPAFSISFGRLLVAGMSSGSMGLSISFIFALMSKLDEIFPNLHVYRNTGKIFESAAVPVIIVIVVALAWLLGVGITAVKFANFTVVRSGDELVISRGLLERRQVTLPLARIQAIRIVEDLLWQPFGFAAVHVESAGYGSDKGETSLLFPLLRRSEIGGFLEQMAPGFHVRPVPVETLPSRAWIGYVVPWTLFLGIATAVAVTFTPWGWLGAPLCLAAAVLGRQQLKDAGWLLANDLLILRFRRLALITVIVPRGRIQSCRTVSNPLQRRRGLATLGISVASRSLGVHFHLRGMRESQCCAVMDWYRPQRK